MPQGEHNCGRKYGKAAVNPVFFFFNGTETTEIYTLSLHDALPISMASMPSAFRSRAVACTLASVRAQIRSEEHTSELQSHSDLVCRLLLEKKKRQASGKRQHQPMTVSKEVDKASPKN